MTESPWKNRVAIAVLLAAIAAWATIRLTAQSSAYTAVQGEVKAAFDDYVRAFSSGRADIIAERVYLTPSFNLATTGVVVAMAPSDVRTRFDASLRALADENYQRSDTKLANICVLNDRAAVVSAQFVRYRKDGSVMSEPAGTYVFAKTAQGWRIVAQIGHSPDRILQCGS